MSAHTTHPYGDHLQAIGAVVINHSGLEAIVASLCIALIRDKAIALPITAGMPITQLQDLVTALYHARVKDADKRAELKAILKEVHEVTELRNQIVHSSWHYSDEAEKMFRLKTTTRGQKGFRLVGLNMTADEISKIAEAIGRVKDKVVRFRDEVEQTLRED